MLEVPVLSESRVSLWNFQGHQQVSCINLHGISHFFLDGYMNECCLQAALLVPPSEQCFGDVFNHHALHSWWLSGCAQPWQLV